MTVVIPDAGGISAAELDRYATQLSQVPACRRCRRPMARSSPVTCRTVLGARPQLTGRQRFLSPSRAARRCTRRPPRRSSTGCRPCPVPAGRHALLTGTAPTNRDTAHAVIVAAALVLAVIAVITFVLMFLLTGSVVLPLKTLLLNGLSLTATFGALVWIFQDGHLGGLGTTATGTLVVTMPALLFCIAFGLSMDYEVFLVSRIREYWLDSNRTPADNDESVALGVARHRPGDHRRRTDHVDLIRSNDRRPGVVHADVRCWG